MTPDTCQHPADPLVASLVSGFDEEARQVFNTRAAALLQAGRFARGHAECLALLGLLQTHPALLTGLTAFAAHLDGGTHWLLTTDARLARQQLDAAGGVDLEEIDPALVVRQQYANLAMLSTFG